MTPRATQSGNIRSLIDAARAAAVVVTGRHQKKASLELYAVLARCAEICERCAASPADLVELTTLFDAQDRGERNRRYIEDGSDINIRVARYVFEADDNRANVYRYSIALREAARRGVRSSEMAFWLRTNGGINALYHTRPAQRVNLSTRCLRLSESIEVPAVGSFTLTLERLPHNVFRPVVASIRDAA